MRVEKAIIFSDEERVTLTKGARGRSTPSIRGVKEAEIIAKTTRETPLNAAPRSTRSLAEAVDVGKDTVQRVGRDNGLKPHRTKGFKVSNDPKFAEKLVDIVGTIWNRLEESAAALNQPILQQTPRGCKAAPHQVRCIAKNLCEPGLKDLFLAGDQCRVQFRNDQRFRNSRQWVNDPQLAFHGTDSSLSGWSCRGHWQSLDDRRNRIGNGDSILKFSTTDLLTDDQVRFVASGGDMASNRERLVRKIVKICQ